MHLGLSAVCAFSRLPLPAAMIRALVGAAIIASALENVPTRAWREFCGHCAIEPGRWNRRPALTPTFIARTGSRGGIVDAEVVTDTEGRAIHLFANKLTKPAHCSKLTCRTSRDSPAWPSGDGGDHLGSPLGAAADVEHPACPKICQVARPYGPLSDQPSRHCRCLGQAVKRQHRAKLGPKRMLDWLVHITDVFRIIHLLRHVHV